MKELRDKRATFSVMIWAGCGLFLVAAFLGCRRIYEDFSSTGIPIHSGGKIIGSVDAALFTIVLFTVAFLAPVLTRGLRGAIFGGIHGSEF